jgi:hypothetical protein
MKRPPLRWQADPALAALIKRYYTGEMGLWETIRRRVDDELRRQQIDRGTYHLRLLGRGSGAYDVLIEDAADYAIEP